MDLPVPPLFKNPDLDDPALKEVIYRSRSMFSIDLGLFFVTLVLVLFLPKEAADQIRCLILMAIVYYVLMSLSLIYVFKIYMKMMFASFLLFKLTLGLTLLIAGVWTMCHFSKDPVSVMTSIFLCFLALFDIYAAWGFLVMFKDLEKAELEKIVQENMTTMDTGRTVVEAGNASPFH
ncbi:hypothetical protein L596_009944 [Steinernema carpocapsae]|uniref:MARVEL domain-containing protein n=1 Tax=Steinernema carpocapsae TaxID=34508 RepID=A0A4U5PHB9_STECR|nr:hypothetical protein L596_009944 [Steinernema carpocapsae]